ncbi:hypothetical protein [Francisella salina]|uniref:Uncharacterized protein n=1 Tax=Francisella salina TaxID=573569 RepID=A0ABM5MC22_FRAST|nr:hypothetical protein [Francisella salina]AEI36823.1 hypothetical protein F7308_1899 [Francisella salina]
MIDSELTKLALLKQISRDDLIKLIRTKKYNNLLNLDAESNKLIANVKLSNLDEDALVAEFQSDIKRDILPNVYPHINHQSIRLKITPLNEKLILQDDKSVEINSFFIEDLKLDLLTSSFSGSIDFTSPYQTEYDAKLIDILSGGLPFNLEISIEQDFFLRDEDRAFIKKNAQLSNENLKFVAYAGNIGLKESRIEDLRFDTLNKKVNSPLIKNNVIYTVDFFDPMSFFWRQHNPIALYSGQCYKDILEEQNKNFEKLVKISFDNSSDICLKQKLPFICMNCSDHEAGFFNYANYIIKEYGLLIIYNYATNEYLITRDYKKSIDSLSNVEKIFTNDKLLFQQIRNIYDKPYLPEYSMMNTDIKIAEKQLLKVDDLKEKPNSVELFKNHKLTQHELTNIFKLKTEKAENHIKNNLAARNTSLEISSKALPCSYSVLPLQNLIKFNSDEWESVFGKNDKQLVLHKASLHFEKSYFTSKNRHSLVEEHKHNDKVFEKNTFDFEEQYIKKYKFLPLMFSNYSKLYLKNPDIWPQPDVSDIPANISLSGYVFTTKVDNKDSTYNSELFDYSADTSKSIAVNENYSSSDEISRLDTNAISRPRYQVKVASDLWTELTPESKQLVPVDLVLPSYANMLFYLKSDTEVDISISLENAKISNIKNYIAPNDMFIEGGKQQNQGIIFENRKEQTTFMQNTYKPSDKSNSFKIVNKPNQGSPSNLEINNTSFSISVDCKK